MTSISKFIIDGSVLEGGGQILRNSIALSGLLSKPVSIQKIRNGRQQPGLKNQHRTGLELAAAIASAELIGATNGSTEVHFTPGKSTNSPQDTTHYEADSVTAGATTLLLQISLPLLIFGSKTHTLTLKGGTNATQAPQIDYTRHVFLPMLRRFGVPSVQLDIKRRGYFPKGGGELYIQIEPTTAPLHAVKCLERGSVRSINGIAHFAGLPGHIGKDMVKGAEDALKEAGYAENEVNIEYKRESNDNTVGAGSGIVLWAELDGGGILGASAVGRKGVHASKVGKEAAEGLIRQLDAGGCVDEWLQDQLIILMALAEGDSEILCGRGGLTLHTQTAIWVMEQLTNAKFDVEELPTDHTIIRCKGIGYAPLQG
ncbi:hypothetical protein V5O48_004098 [Marasmius crinis-equi]|uniref:RNA 3'-terminal-phosphate cyclase (ATP) n=1 Tax=Marasmius crinis-equi TaxID=585013 RepID=A0ABR3FR23_9AGAR